jgi:hypothetical protein
MVAGERKDGEIRMWSGGRVKAMKWWTLGQAAADMGWIK